jgi:hypothetical protein
VNRARQRPQPHRPQPIPGTDVELDGARVVERPDGYYVQLVEEGREIGPYETLVEAIEDQRIPGDEEDLGPAESLAEAEAELGVADWIDPETASLAEDHVPRLEEH